MKKITILFLLSFVGIAHGMEQRKQRQQIFYLAWHKPYDLDQVFIADITRSTSDIHLELKNDMTRPDVNPRYSDQNYDAYLAIDRKTKSLLEPGQIEKFIQYEICKKRTQSSSEINDDTKIHTINVLTANQRAQNLKFHEQSKQRK